MTGWAAAAAAVLAAFAVGVATGPLLRRLPEPAHRPPDKVDYAALATRRFVTGCAVLTAVGVAVSWLIVPVAARPLWLVLSTLGVLLAAIDARSTWLPLRLTRISWLAGAAAVLAGGVWAGVLGDPWWRQVLGPVLGAAAAGGLYYLAWALTKGGFGFGDVRFAPLVGAAAAACSPHLLLWSLLLGSGAGAGYAIGRLLARRRDPFPYAPAILTGAYLALGVDLLLR